MGILDDARAIRSGRVRGLIPFETARFTLPLRWVAQDSFHPAFGAFGIGHHRPSHFQGRMTRLAPSQQKTRHFHGGFVRSEDQKA